MAKPDHYECKPDPIPSPATVDPLLRLALAVIKQAVRDMATTNNPIEFLDCLDFLRTVAPRWLELSDIEVKDDVSILGKVRMYERQRAS
jgi:hypothetical protein